ncbi:MAG: VirB8/TrbF family protein [Pseudomonadota bacterium]|nr:VirB8/TrbF family protein [Pseudomonadota bacterium]
MNKHQPDAELKSYFREAGSWAGDRQEQAARSQRVAWIIAGVATTIAALEAIALAGLMPLKTVVPHTVLVDQQTGHVTTLDPTKPVQLTPDNALAKSMLAQYVMARETLDRGTVSSDYRKVALWSGETARSSYLALMNPGNPANPLARLPRQIIVQARIKSVSLLDNGQALVRYDLVQRNDTGSESRPAPYVSVIRYRFRDRPLAESDRFINPLGFEVLRYRKDPEAPLTSGELAPASPAIAAGTAAPATQASAVGVQP